MITTAQVDKARRYARRRGFPQLTGTPRQVEWAEVLRWKLMRGFDTAIRAGQGYRRAASAQGTREWSLSHTEATWWIDNRGQKASTAASVRNRQQGIAICELLLGPRKAVRR